MANQVAWFEVVGQDGAKLRSFYGDVFGWQFQLPEGEGMEDVDYGMTDPSLTGTVFFQQAAVLAPGANAAGALTTNAGQGIVGIR